MKILCAGINDVYIISSTYGTGAPSNPICGFKNSDVMALSGKICCGSKPGNTCPDYNNFHLNSGDRRETNYLLMLYMVEFFCFLHSLANISTVYCSCSSV